MFSVKFRAGPGKYRHSYLMSQQILKLILEYVSKDTVWWQHIYQHMLTYVDKYFINICEYTKRTKCIFRMHLGVFFYALALNLTENYKCVNVNVHHAKTKSPFKKSNILWSYFDHCCVSKYQKLFNGIGSCHLHLFWTATGY